MLLPLILVQASDPAVAAIQSGVSAVVEYDATEAKRRIRATYYVQANRTLASIRQVQPSQNGLDRTDTLYWLGSELRAFDRVNNDWLARKVPSKESPLVSLVGAVGLPIEPLASSLDPVRLATFLKRLRDRSAGTLTAEANQWHWHGGTLDIRVGFEPKSHRLKKVRVFNPKATASWEIRYLPLKAIPELKRPTGSTVVKSLVIGPAIPACDDSGTESTLRRMLRANRAMVDTEIDIDGDATLLVGRRAVGESFATRKWLYVDGLLAYRDAKASSKIACRRSDLLDKLAALDWPVHPLLREYLARRVLFANAMLPGGKARTVGHLQVRGQDVTVVDITAPLGSISLSIRSDGRVLTQSSTVKDKVGRTLSSTDQQFTYRQPAQLSNFR